MRQAGADGPLDQLRARAYLHLLCGQPACTLTGGDVAAGQPRPGQCRPRHLGADPGAQPAGPARDHSPHHAAGQLARLVGEPGRGSWVRPAGRGRRTGSGHLARRSPRDHLVRYAHRHRRQAAHGCAGLVPGPAEPGRPAAHRRRRCPGSGRLAAPDHYHAAADQRLRPSPGRQRLPARTQAAAPHPGPQRVLYRARVPSAGRTLRSGPHIRTIWAAGPAHATFLGPVYAITAASKPRAGISASRGPASCAGPRPQHLHDHTTVYGGSAASVRL